jgi:hypothetical protein
MIGNIMINCNEHDPFISKFDTNGNAVWAKAMGGRKTEMGGLFSMDITGNLYVTGDFQDSIFFDNILLTSSSMRDWFLAKFDNEGNALWARQGHITGATVYYGEVFCDITKGNVLAVGTFSGSAAFGENNISACSANDIFLVCYNSDGECMGVSQAPNSFQGGINADKLGNIYLTGAFQGLSTFGSTSLNSFGSDDAFIARHNAITGLPRPPEAPAQRLEIFANPTTGVCSVTVPAELEHEPSLTLRLFDSNGRLLKSFPVTPQGTSVRLSLEEQASGIYHVTLGNEEKVYSGKVVFRK